MDNFFKLPRPFLTRCASHKKKELVGEKEGRKLKKREGANVGKNRPPQKGA